MSKIALFGATGRIGLHILAEALSRDHRVTGVTRNAARAAITHVDELIVVEGDVLKDVARIVAGHDVVISALGAPRDGKPDFLVRAARALVKGLKKADVRRLLVVGGAGMLEVSPGERLLETKDYPKALRPVSQAHVKAMAALEKSNLDWTVLSPAANLASGKRTGKYRTSEGKLLRDAEGESRLSYEDFAVALLDEVEKPKFIGKHMGVAY